MQVDTLGPTLEEQIREQPLVAPVGAILEEIKTVTIGSSALNNLGNNQSWNRELNALIEKNIQSKMGREEGFLEVMQLITSHPLTPLPIAKGDSEATRLEKIAVSTYGLVQDIARRLSSVAQKDFSQIKEWWEKPIEGFGKGATLGSVITQALATQYQRGKWLEENVFTHLSAVAKNAIAKVDALARLLYKEHVNSYLSDPLENIHFLANFNYDLMEGDNWVGAGCYDLAEHKICLRVSGLTGNSLKRMEGTAIHELYHYHSDHLREVLVRDIEGKFVKITAKDPVQLLHALQPPHLPEAKSAVRTEHCIPKNEKLNLTGMPQTACQCLGLIPMALGGGLKNLSKERENAFTALNEAVTELFALQVDRIANLSHNKRLYEEGLNNLEIPGYSYHKNYYKKASYQVEIEAFLNAITELGISSNSFFRAALSSEGMIRLQDKLMRNPKLAEQGSSGLERLGHVADLVYQETARLKKGTAR